MIDAYTHLDMGAEDPLADLQQRMRAASVDRALIVETWSGDNRSCLRQLMASPLPAFRVAPCFRPGHEQSGIEFLSLECVQALRVKTADLDQFGPAAAMLQSSRKWLLAHAESGIAALTDKLLHLVALYPAIRIYLPHMGWPRRDKQDDSGWRNSISKLSKLPNLVVGISAIAHFSLEEFPHEDVAPFASHLLATLGEESLLAATDYPLLEEHRYAEYLQLADNWIGNASQPGHRFETSLFGEQRADQKE